MNDGLGNLQDIQFIILSTKNFRAEKRKSLRIWKIFWGHRRQHLAVPCRKFQDHFLPIDNLETHSLGFLGNPDKYEFNHH